MGIENGNLYCSFCPLLNAWLRRNVKGVYAFRLETLPRIFFRVKHRMSYSFVGQIANLLLCVPTSGRITKLRVVAPYPAVLKSRWGNQGRTQSTFKETGLFIRRFLKKGGGIPNLLLVYLLYKEPTFKDGGVMFKCAYTLPAHHSRVAL